MATVLPLPEEAKANQRAGSIPSIQSNFGCFVEYLGILFGGVILLSI